MEKHRICIVDDESPNLESLARILKSETCEVSAFNDPLQALNAMQLNHYDLLLTDLKMPVMNGLELLETIKKLENPPEVVLLTAFGTVELAVEAMRKGAYDFIIKPMQRAQVLKVVHNALERHSLIRENRTLKEGIAAVQHGNFFAGTKSRAMAEIFEQAKQAAKSKAHILIDGESGTGKGVLAEFIHQNRNEANGLLVKINCAAIPETLLEAELFGYEPGAFTGAQKRKKGRVELANGGTLFLDEIGITPPTFQSKLLRFLQEGEFERLGGNETLKVDTRVISATNVDLKSAIKSGLFREDLFYRLNVIHFQMPALRERKEDIPILIHHFAAQSARKNGRTTPQFSSATIEVLESYPWPGNIRELQNMIERLVVLSVDANPMIELKDLPAEFANQPRQPRTLQIPVGQSLKNMERLFMQETLRFTQGDRKIAARLLGVHPRTIHRFLESIEMEEQKQVLPTESTQ